MDTIVRRFQGRVGTSTVAVLHALSIAETGPASGR